MSLKKGPNIGRASFVFHICGGTLSTSVLNTCSAAGLRVTSTAVADVVETYGRQGLVTIADGETIAATLKTSLGLPPEDWREAVDRCLALMSWAGTWDAMQNLIHARLRVTEEV